MLLIEAPICGAKREKKKHVEIPGLWTLNLLIRGSGPFWPYLPVITREKGTSEMFFSSGNCQENMARKA